MIESQHEVALREAQRLIQEALETGATELNLSGLTLGTLPDELSLLAKQLLTLDLSYCEGLQSLTGIEMLTQLTCLSIEGCTSLTSLAGIKALVQLKSLDISYCDGLTNLTEIKTLVQLEDLDINSCEGLSSLTGIESLVQLEKLDINSCFELTSLAGIENLKQLKFLDISWCQELTGINEIAALEQLTSLDMFCCPEITSLAAIKSLTQLTNLDIRLCTRLNSLAGIEDLKLLTKLYLSHNRSIKSLQEVTTLTQLEELTIGEMEQSNIGFLSQLQALYYLNLEDNHIQDITPLTRLPQLRHLNLENNKISEIATLSKLTHVQELKLAGNPFAKHFDVSLESGKNSLSVIKNLLFRLGESSDEATTLPAKVLFLGNHAAGKSSLVHYLTKQTLKDDSNSTHILQIEPYQLQKKASAKSRKEKAPTLPAALFYDFGGQDYYHGIYRVFMSQQATTCLLWHPGSDHNKIAFDSNELQNRYFSCEYWLGYWRHYNLQKQNQQVEGSTPENDSSPTDQDDSAPLLLIQSHADQPSDSPTKVCPEAYNQHLLSLHPQRQNALHKSSLRYFKAQLDSLIAENQKKVPAALWYGKFLQRILDKHEQSSARYKPAEAISDWVSYYNPTNPDIGLRLEHLKTEFSQLHAQGLVLYYPTVNADKVWLHPMAFAHHVHNRVLAKQRIEKLKGVVATKEFEKYDPDIVAVLEQEKVIFRHNHGKKGEEYLVPNYLPLAQEGSPEYALLTFGLQNSLAFNLWFQEYLPVGLINQLVCHFGNLPDIKKFWRDQLLFTLGADNEFPSRVLIKLIFDEHLQIQVFIDNLNAEQHSKHLTYVYYVIMSLYNDFTPLQNISEFENYFSDFKKREKIALYNQEIDGGSEQKHKLLNITATLEFQQIYRTPPKDLWLTINNQDYIQARQLAQTKEETQLPAISFKREQQATKLVSITPFAPFTHKNLNKMLKVFVSYSHDDIAARRDLQQYLINLERDGIIEIWQDGMINTGDNWHQSINTALDQADIIIMLVSQSFIASSYVHTVEMPKAMALKEGGKAKIFPILLSNCDYQHWHIIPEPVREQLPETNTETEHKVAIGQYQFFPMNKEQHLEPINRWQYPEDAWSQVAKRLRELSQAN